jgi:hypothetical protein
VIRARNEQYREILASLTGALANPGAKRIYNDGTRAHALSRFLSDLKTAFIEEIVRPGILAGEKSVLDRAGTPVVTAEAELEKRCGNDDAIGLETEIVRASALELKQYRRRHHLMVIAPVWQAPRSAVQDPNAVFFSGPPAQQTLVQSVCKSRALTLLPGQRAGTASAAFRWQQLWTANVAMFDLSGYDSSNPIPSSVQVASACYELGIAFALGRSVVTLAHEGQAMPFDVDVAPLCLGGGDGDATALGEAIDAALYATQRGAGISSLHATLDYARKILTGKQEWIDGESATDPVHVNRLLQHALAESGLRGQLAVLPAWPGAYPDPASPRCFHVMAFRSEFNWTVDVVSRICGEHGINYVRGDRVLEPDIIRSIWEEICRATHVIVDVTGSNPNVLLELGIAHTLGRNVLIVSQEKSSIGAVPSLAKLRTHLYSEQASPDAGSLALVVGDFLTAQAKR